VRARFKRAQGTSRNEALAAEVKERLQQARSLDANRIDVIVEDEGKVVLKGQVPDDDSKELAVDLTRDIRGVVRVEDHLAVPPKSRVFAAAPDDEKSTPVRTRRTR
jgi:osmotically-inducible protein OsmY